MARMSIGYPSHEDEALILKRKSESDPLKLIKAIVSKEDVLLMQKEVEHVFVHESLLTYIVSLVHATRNHEGIRQGASPRASISLLQLAKASAYVHTRDYVVPSDIQDVFYDVIGHRVVLTNGNSEKETRAILEGILHEIEVPAEK